MMGEEDNKLIRIGIVSYRSESDMIIQFNRLFNVDGFDKFELVVSDGITNFIEEVLSGEQVREMVWVLSNVVDMSVMEKVDRLTEMAIDEVHDLIKNHKDVR